MSEFPKSSSWPEVCAGLAIAIALLLVVFYVSESFRPPFFTTTSPDATYTVNLYGQKERPALLTVEVGAVVHKAGQIFWPYQTLHAGDAMDISFELGWPNHRWIGENAIQFYREKNFTEFKHEQALILTNTTDKVVRHLRIECEDKFLVFDIQPASEIVFEASPPKGDFQGLWATGKFDDGVGFTENATYDVRSVGQPFTIHVFVTPQGVTVKRVF